MTIPPNKQDGSSDSPPNATRDHSSASGRAGANTNQTQSAAGSTSQLSLEEIVHLSNKIGLEYAEAKKEAERLDMLKHTIRAQITIRHDNGELSEARLRRLTETDPEYIQFLEDFSEAKLKSEKLKVRYESYKNLFEARRSMMSYQKAEMKLI